MQRRGAGQGKERSEYRRILLSKYEITEEELAQQGARGKFLGAELEEIWLADQAETEASVDVDAEYQTQGDGGIEAGR